MAAQKRRVMPTMDDFFIRQLKFGVIQTSRQSGKVTIGLYFLVYLATVGTFWWS
uniref:Uncharacterized protein n=1 Tax=Picea sitchensis TaxID=3332 RepID=D5A8Y0_PICSI|nr:unknown [Picea sitchensis]